MKTLRIHGLVETEDGKVLNDPRVVARFGPNSEVEANCIRGGTCEYTAMVPTTNNKGIEDHTFTLTIDNKSKFYLPLVLERLLRFYPVDHPEDGLRIDVELQLRKEPKDPDDVAQLLMRGESAMGYLRQNPDPSSVLTDVWLRCLKDDQPLASEAMKDRALMKGNSDMVFVQRMLDFIQYSPGNFGTI